MFLIVISHRAIATHDKQFIVAGCYVQSGVVDTCIGFFELLINQRTSDLIKIIVTLAGQLSQIDLLDFLNVQISYRVCI